MSIQGVWDFVVVWVHELIQQALSINPTQRAVLWLQLFAGFLTVLWIIFQFAWLRRLNEARLERYLEDRIATERDFLAKERAEVLLKIDRFSKARGLSRAVLLAWAHFRLAISLVLRILSLGTTRGLTDHTTLLMQVGLLHRARSIHTEVAQDAMRKMRLYQEAVSNKRIEAQNALLFAGRIAILEGRPVAAVAAFRTAKCLKDDPDARLLIGQQLADTGDFGSALAEYKAALEQPTLQASTRAELHRSLARIYMQQNLRGKARVELELAREIDQPLVTMRASVKLMSLSEAYGRQGHVIDLLRKAPTRPPSKTSNVPRITVPFAGLSEGSVYCVVRLLTTTDQLPVHLTGLPASCSN